MSVVDLTQPSEVVGQFIKELQANTSQAQALRDALKQNKSYDNNAIWTQIVADNNVKTAFNRLRENLPASDYNTRVWRRYHLNSQALSSNYSNQSFTNNYDQRIDQLISGGVLQWFDTGQGSTSGADITFLDGTARRFTVPAPGLYRFLLTMCAAFFPVGMSQSDFSLYNIDPVTHTRNTAKFSVTLEVYNGAVKTHTIALANSRLSRKDMADRRRHIFGGSVEIDLPAGAIVELVFQRAGRFGTYTRTAGGTSTVNESIGFSKVVPFDAPANTRDTQNWLEVIRVS